MIDKHICLIGFMGAGKSTIGGVLAQYLNVEFIDLDGYIEETKAMTVSQIFAAQGELHFRETEYKYLTDLLRNSEKTVIALGGGTPCNEKIWEELKFVNCIYLKAGVDKLHNRLSKDESNNRPLIQGKSTKKLRSFIASKLRQRRGYYERCNTTILSKGTPEEIVHRILLKLDSR